MALKIILGDSYTNYTESLKKLDLDTLAVRRDKLCLKFAKKCIKNEKFQHWFPKKSLLNTRSKESKGIYSMPKFKKKRYQTSSIPYLITILNKN